MGIVSKIPIKSEADVVTARMEARQMARQLGFSTVDQARISLATSELARLVTTNENHSGEIVMSGASQAGHDGMQVVCLVNPPATVATGNSSPVATNTSLSDTLKFRRGLSGASRLVDESVIEIEDSGQTKVTLFKWFS